MQGKLGLCYTKNPAQSSQIWRKRLKKVQSIGEGEGRDCRVFEFREVEEN